MGRLLQWDEPMILLAIVEFFERESRWPDPRDFTRAHGLPSLRLVYQKWGSPAHARQWAMHSLIAWDDDFPVEWQILASPY